MSDVIHLEGRTGHRYVLGTEPRPGRSGPRVDDLGWAQDPSFAEQVTGRPARIRERPLVEEHQVGPPESRKMSDETVPDDPGADHHAVRAVRHLLARFLRQFDLP